MNRRAEILYSQRTDYPGSKTVDQFRFKLIGDNGEPIAWGEQYTQKHNVTEVLEEYFPTFEVKDLTATK
jgi:hypothetical protein